MNYVCNLIECGKCFEIKPSTLKKKSKSGLHFCSVICKNNALRNGINGETRYLKLIPQHYLSVEKNKCKRCNLICRTYQTFCSRQCCTLFKKEQNIRKWLSGEDISTQMGAPAFVRAYLLDECKNRCTKCGWAEINTTTGKSPLELNHIDGDFKNNVKSNLEILCPNCHSLTYNWKALNIGTVEKSRYLINKEKGWW